MGSGVARLIFLSSTWSAAQRFAAWHLLRFSPTGAHRPGGGSGRGGVLRETPSKEIALFV